MSQQSSKKASQINEAIESFLKSPPEGTPAEIIEAFGAPGVNSFLPPKLFLEAVEQAPIAISITDQNATILYVNRAFEQLTRFQRDEVIGKNESILSSKSTPVSVYQDLWKTIQNKNVWRGTLINHRKDKEEYLAELVIAPVLNPHNEVAYYLGMHRDITSVHQLEQQLNFQKTLTEAALDAAPIVVAMIDANRKVLLDNHAYKALLGDFRGLEPASLIIDVLENQLGFNISDVCHVGKSFTNIEVRLDTPSGSTRWFSCSGVRVAELDEATRNYFNNSDNMRCCLLLIANEITASRKRINEARLNMIRASMAEQQIVQTMREAISASIYKLQVPLNIARAALSMPVKDTRNGSLATVLQQVYESGEEAMESLHTALPGPLIEQSTNININEIIHEVIKLSTDKLLSSGVVIDWRPATTLPLINGRVNSLRGLFKYLIDNSIQAVNEAGRDYREIRIETKHEDDELIICVLDNGAGITEALRFKVFEPFFCCWEDAREHAGMGLTMAQEVAVNHGGSIEVDANFIGGCRIQVKLPLDKTANF